MKTQGDTLTDRLDKATEEKLSVWKPGVTDQQFARDKYECLRETDTPSGGSVYERGAQFLVNRERFFLCLKARGYTVLRGEEAERSWSLSSSSYFPGEDMKTNNWGHSLTRDQCMKEAKEYAEGFTKATQALQVTRVGNGFLLEGQNPKGEWKILFTCLPVEKTRK